MFNMTKLLFRARRPGLVGGDTNTISRIMKQIKESKTNTEKEKEPVVQKTDAERRRSLLKSRGSRPLPSVVAPSADFKLQILEKGSVVNKENSIKNFHFFTFCVSNKSFLRQSSHAKIYFINTIYHKLYFKTKCFAPKNIFDFKSFIFR